MTYLEREMLQSTREEIEEDGTDMDGYQEKAPYSDSVETTSQYFSKGF